MGGMEVVDGAGIRETCGRSEPCRSDLDCLGWPTGYFCTPRCGYSSNSAQPHDPPCPDGYALECHVSNACVPIQCNAQQDCPSNYSCLSGFCSL